MICPTKKYAIEPDSQLHIQEGADGSLRITPLQIRGPPELREAIVRLLEQDELTLTTLLENYFIDGYDRLILESRQTLNEHVRKLLTRIVDHLHGYEIIGSTNRRIVIKSVTSIRADDLSEFVKICSRITLELIEKLIRALKTSQDVTAQIANEVITEGWRQRSNYLRAQRELRKALITPPPGLTLTAPDILDTSFFILQLNNIHENLQHIAEALIRRQPPPEQNKIAVAALTRVHDNLKKAVSAFLQRNQEMVHQVLGEIPILRQWKRQTETIVDVMKDSIITQIILDRMEEILTYSSGIVKTALLLKT